MSKWILLTLAAITIPLPGHAAVYQCQVNGSTVFSDRPCGDDAKELDHKAAPMIGGSMATEQGETFVEQRQIERKIRRLEREKDQAEHDMDKALADWQRNKRRAANNLAGATWENSLAQEAEVLRKRYQSEIDSINAEIEELRERKAEL
ncbi:DUF4124 domain-containing protein [Marinobacter lacisalsi]|uniref:DUF4124 domain-containing protein n=1 Tax=Marinobacter lacisalsi TaxID=475979 RepID=A0ABV8QFS5_9GAMM